MPRWQSNFNKNSVTAKLVSEIAVEGERSVPPIPILPGFTHNSLVLTDRQQTAANILAFAFIFHFHRWRAPALRLATLQYLEISYSVRL